MKLDGKQINNLEVVGEENTRTAKINEKKLGKLQYLLTNGLYSDGIGSTIVEITNNALDSIVMSGKDPMKNPVYVYLELNSNAKHQLRIVDNGLGLDETEFSEVVMNYLTSTKEDNDDAIGAFGIGAKSWCSISNSATFICRKDGKEYNFLVYKGDTFLKYDKLYEKDTTEENGVTFILPIKDYWQRTNFEAKAKQKLAYYDNVILSIDGRVQNNVIYRNDLFQFSTMSSTNVMHFSLKDVYYTIDWEALGIPTIKVPVCLRFSLKEGIMPTPSRENIIYTDDTKNLIKDKIKKVAEWFVEKQKEQVGSFKSLFEAFDKIDSDDIYVTVNEKPFKANDLFTYLNVKPADVTIKGIKLMSPSFYKKHFSELLFEYDIVSYIKETWMKNRFPALKNQLFDHKSIVLLDSTPVGRFKTFLGQNYSYTLFVVRKNSRKLSNYSHHSTHGYYQLLNLKDVPKTEWRAYITEWNNVQLSIEKEFTDERGAEFSQEYMDWVEEEKQRIKDARKNNPGKSNYKGLNKQVGEITVGTARKHVNTDDVVFDRGTLAINTLHKLGYLTVYFLKSQVSENELFIKKAFHALPSVKFVYINPREEKFVKNLKTWKTKEQFMFSKPLKRYITANLIQEYLRLIPSKNEKIIFEAFPKYASLKETLKKYADANYVKGEDRLFTELKKTAVENNLLDMDIYADLQEFKKVMDQFGFLAYLKETESWNSSEVERRAVKNMVYIMLKYKKVECKLLEDYKLVPVYEEIPLAQVAYYQPKLGASQRIIGHETIRLTDNEVWNSRDNLLKEYPNATPIAYRRGDIPNYEVQDPKTVYRVVTTDLNYNDHEELVTEDLQKAYIMYKTFRATHNDIVSVVLHPSLVLGGDEFEGWKYQDQEELAAFNTDYPEDEVFYTPPTASVELKEEESIEETEVPAEEETFDDQDQALDEDTQEAMMIETEAQAQMEVPDPEEDDVNVDIDLDIIDETEPDVVVEEDGNSRIEDNIPFPSYVHLPQEKDEEVTEEDLIPGEFY